MTEYVPSEAEDLADNGYCCSCHLSPPCNFCVALDEEECDMWCECGMVGLRHLWARRYEKWEAEHG